MEEEVRVIAECLDYEEGGFSGTSGGYSSIGSLTSPALLHHEAEDEIETKDWQELSLLPIPLSERSKTSKVKPGNWKCQSAGLAPNGSCAWFLSSSFVLLRWLTPPRHGHRDSMVFKKERLGKSNMERAALSERFLAVISTDALAVWDYQSASIGDEDIVVKASFNSDSVFGGWGPTSVAIHETCTDVRTDVYIAVGGVRGQKHRAGFALYQLENRGLDMVLKTPKYCTSPTNTGYVKSISFSTDGTMLACLTDSNVLVWTREQTMEESAPQFSISRKFTEVCLLHYRCTFS